MRCDSQLVDSAMLMELRLRNMSDRKGTDIYGSLLDYEAEDPSDMKVLAFVVGSIRRAGAGPVRPKDSSKSHSPNCLLDGLHSQSKSSLLSIREQGDALKHTVDMSDQEFSLRHVDEVTCSRQL